MNALPNEMWFEIFRRVGICDYDNIYNISKKFEYLIIKYIQTFYNKEKDYLYEHCHSYHVVKHLTSYVPIDDDQGALCVVSLLGNIEAVKLLLSEINTTPIRRSCVCLIWAAKSNHIDVVSLLLKDGRVDPASHQSLSLCSACIRGYTDIAALLLKDDRANPADENSFCLVLAAKYGHTDIVKMLLADPRIQTDNGALSFASQNRHASDVIEILLKDTRIDPTSYYNHQSIAWTCRYSHYENALLLLADGRIEPDYHCVELAVENGDTKMIDILKKDGRAFRLKDALKNIREQQNGASIVHAV